MTSPLFDDWIGHSYGIDWLTVTTIADNIGTFEEAIAAYCVQEGISRNVDMKEGSIRDFKGSKWGKCFVGKNKTHAMLNISSFVGWDVFLAAAARGHVKVTRIDLQMTGYSPSSGKYLGRELERTLLDRKAHEEMDTRIQIHSRHNEGEVGTVYIGSDNSDKKCRVYNKTKQAKIDTGEYHLWRWEMQLRNDIANHCAQHLVASPEQSVNVQRYLCGYLEGWRIVVREGLQAHKLKFQSVEGLRDAGKKFNWLVTQCIPTMRKLIHDEDYGPLVEQLLITLLNDPNDGLHH